MVEMREKCIHYLTRIGNYLRERGVALTGTDHMHDIHGFFAVPRGLYTGKTLHIQVYPGMSRDDEVVLAGYIKEQNYHNANNVASFGQKFLPWEDFSSVMEWLDGNLKLDPEPTEA